MALQQIITSMTRVIKDDGDFVWVEEYLHGEDDELSDLWDYDAPQQRTFRNALYEVKFVLVVKKSTGESTIYSVECGGQTLIAKEYSD